MTTLEFSKGHATANDFVMLLDPEGDIEMNAATVRFLSDRREGIGGDGVIRAVRAGRLDAGSDLDADTWFMDYWNADGSTAQMCGNGVRLFAAFLRDRVGLDLRQGVPIGTRAGVRTVTDSGGSGFAVTMGPVILGDDRSGSDAVVEADGIGSARPALSVSVGNPHHVVALSSLAELEALDLTRAPRVSPTPPEGSNVEFAVAMGAHERGQVRMRVHERGVGETRSCGTGAVAVAAAVRSWAGPNAPRVWDVQVPGGLLTVDVTGDEAILTGPAVLVSRGQVLLPDSIAG